MAWIQQTKQRSRKSGGPQYYVQGLEDRDKSFLHAQGACEVWLCTPYGVVQSGLMAVAGDRVLHDGRLRGGNVGHDRIQRQSARLSIGEQVKHWFNIGNEGEPDRIDFFFRNYKRAFILVPRRIAFAGGRGRGRSLHVDPQPLTFTDYHRSELIQKQALSLRQKPQTLRWVIEQLDRVVHDHVEDPCPHLKEEDLLRTSGALSHLGIALSAYCGKGYDCINSIFTFSPFPAYKCAVEIKKVSSGFNYQILKRTNPERATVLCMTHKPAFVPPDVVDVLELRSLLAFLKSA